ncbi:MAG: response regulator [Actinobacteria bacterium]|nr:response regulator [Actinomycetota bacterium]
MKKILVVDDDADIQLLMGLVLSEHDITSASSGAEALALVEAGEYDVVLLDVKMPQMDGFATLEHLRALPSFESFCVVMLTGHDSEPYHLRAYESGADAYLTKPFHPHQLRECIAEVTSRSPAVREQVRRQEVEVRRHLAEV